MPTEMDLLRELRANFSSFSFPNSSEYTELGRVPAEYLDSVATSCQHVVRRAFAKLVALEARQEDNPQRKVYLQCMAVALASCSLSWTNPPWRRKGWIKRAREPSEWNPRDRKSPYVRDVLHTIGGDDANGEAAPPPTKRKRESRASAAPAERPTTSDEQPRRRVSSPSVASPLISKDTFMSTEKASRDNLGALHSAASLSQGVAHGPQPWIGQPVANQPYWPWVAPQPSSRSAGALVPPAGHAPPGARFAPPLHLPLRAPPLPTSGPTLTSLLQPQRVHYVNSSMPSLPNFFPPHAQQPQQPQQQ